MDNIHANWQDTPEVAMGMELSDPNQPYSCASCKKIVNRKCFNCHKNTKQLINGTSIRKLLIRNLKIPDIYMRKEISNLLGSNSIIQK